MKSIVRIVFIVVFCFCALYSQAVYAKGQTVSWETLESTLAQLKPSGDVLILPTFSPESPVKITIPKGVDKLTIKGSKKLSGISIVSQAPVELTIFNVSLDAPEKQAGIALASGSTLQLKGSNSIQGGNGCAAISVIEGTSLIIKGNGKLLAQAGYLSAGIGGSWGTSAGKISILDGTIRAIGMGGAGIGGGDGFMYRDGDDEEIFQGGNGGTITIEGGNTTAIGRFDGAGIGGGSRGYSGDITIKGGKVFAYCVQEQDLITDQKIYEFIPGQSSSENETLEKASDLTDFEPDYYYGFASAIGDGGGEGYENYGKIEIFGGFIQAISDGGTGVGGDTCSVYIYGGTVSAKACANGVAWGAGIGSTDIMISGGKIEAESATGTGIGVYGTAINGKPDGTIVISGGNITAKSFYGAAAIGSDNRGTAVDIRITGGTIRVEDGSKQYVEGIGIGSGQGAGSASISISGKTRIFIKSRDTAIGDGHNAKAGSIKILDKTVVISAESIGEYIMRAPGILNNGTVNGIASGEEYFYNVEPEGSGKFVGKVKKVK